MLNIEAPGDFVGTPAAPSAMAGGHSIERIAADQGCPPQAIRRDLRRSRKFRQRIERDLESRRLAAQLRFGATGENAVLRFSTARRNSAIDGPASAGSNWPPRGSGQARTGILRGPAAPGGGRGEMPDNCAPASLLRAPDPYAN
ncbi:MAG TPA: hypothetical protein VF194_09245 [Ferrovibrio sp.]|jgi:hypothetical protein|uniref:hypothetical protein n=1 Tax=Ferrovibrio sp. TaxID=1917215 RepID=UPI002ED265DC